jgi:hypothetical protein
MSSNEPNTDETSEATEKRMWTTISKDQALVSLPCPPHYMRVPRWNSTHEAAGWKLHYADMSMPGGRPYGMLFYIRTTDKMEVRVGVRWDVHTEQPETACLMSKRNAPLRDREGNDADALELDARARVTAMMSIFSLIGATIATTATEDVVLEAAGLGLPRIYEDEPAQ